MTQKTVFSGSMGALLLSVALGTAAEPEAVPPSTVEKKLDRILNKLEEMDRRLTKLEEAQTAVPELSADTSVSLGDVVDGILGWFGVGVINVYSSDPNRRIQELLKESEDLRKLEEEWKRVWLPDAPTHLTPERVHGGIQ
jgi:hypothetical protein